MGASIPTQTVLLVDDEAAILRSLARVFTRHGWTCELASTPLCALDALDARARAPFDALVADFRMDPLDGVELCRRALSAGFDGAMVLYSGYVTTALHKRAARQGIHAVVPKDTEADALAQQLAALCDLRTSAPRNARPEALGPRRPSAALGRRYARAHKLSPHETQALLWALRGESRAQAADRIGCRPSTVATYWQRICAKTRIVTQADVLLDVFRFALDGDGRNQ